ETIARVARGGGVERPIRVFRLSPRGKEVYRGSGRKPPEDREIRSPVDYLLDIFGPKPEPSKA
ncbi:MAG: hypothetical protein V1908_04170, partial [Candidatus Peregrinibacteria bacterium]